MQLGLGLGLTRLGQGTSDLRAQVISALGFPTATGVWFEAQSSYYADTSLTTQGSLNDTIGGIKDVSGNNLHATQADAVKRTIQRAYGTEYDAVDDHYTMPVAGGAPSDSNTIVTAVHLTSNTGNRYIFSEYPSDNGVLLLFQNGIIRPAVVQTTGLKVENGTTNIFGAWHVVSLIYDRANLRLIGRVDGVEEVKIAVADADKTSVSENLSYFGWRGSVESAFWHGLIGDFAITNRVLSSSELSLVEQAFADKAGVTLL